MRHTSRYQRALSLGVRGGCSRRARRCRTAARSRGPTRSCRAATTRSSPRAGPHRSMASWTSGEVVGDVRDAVVVVDAAVGRGRVGHRRAVLGDAGSEESGSAVQPRSSVAERRRVDPPTHRRLGPPHLALGPSARGHRAGVEVDARACRSAGAIRSRSPSEPRLYLQPSRSRRVLRVAKAARAGRRTSGSRARRSAPRWRHRRGSSVTADDRGEVQDDADGLGMRGPARGCVAWRGRGRRGGGDSRPGQRHARPPGACSPVRWPWLADTNGSFSVIQSCTLSPSREATTPRLSANASAVSDRPASPSSQGLRQVPVVQRWEAADPGSEQRVDETVVEVEAGRVDLLPPLRHDGARRPRSGMRRDRGAASARCPRRSGGSGRRRRRRRAVDDHPGRRQNRSQMLSPRPSAVGRPRSGRRTWPNPSGTSGSRTGDPAATVEAIAIIFTRHAADREIPVFGAPRPDIVAGWGRSLCTCF